MIVCELQCRIYATLQKSFSCKLQGITLAAMKTFGNFFERMKELIPSQQSTSARTTPNSRYQGEPATTLSDRPSNATDEEEHFRLALRISAAEAQGAFQESSRYPTLPPVPIREPQAHDRNAKPAPVNDTASDELLARHLQDQLNLEQHQANLGASGASTSSQRPQNPNPFSPPLPKPSQSSDHPPSMASNGAYPDSGSVIAPGPPPRDPPLWAGFRSQLSTAINAALAPALPSANTCAGCGKAVQPWHGSYVVAAGKTWHTWCLKCAHCQQPIQVSWEPSRGWVPLRRATYCLCEGGLGGGLGGGREWGPVGSVKSLCEAFIIMLV